MFQRVCAFAAVAAIVVVAACGGGAGSTSSTSSPQLALLAGNIGGPAWIDGDGTDARFIEPLAIAADASGNLIVYDFDKLRGITSSGTVSTIADVDRFSDTQPNFGPQTVVIAGDGARWVSETDGLHRVSAASGDQLVPSIAPSQWFRLAADAQGNAYVLDGCAVWKVTPSLARSLFAGATDDCHLADGPPGQGRFRSPASIASDRQGALYLLDVWSGESDGTPQSTFVRKIDAAGTITTIVGGAGNQSVDGQGLNARFAWPSIIAADGLGNLYIADAAVIRRVDAALNVTTLADLRAVTIPSAFSPYPYEMDMVADEQGDLFFASPYDTAIRVVRAGSRSVSIFAGLPVDGTRKDGRGPDARFESVRFIASDSTGDILAPSYSYDAGLAIRRVTLAGTVTTEATRPFGADRNVVPIGYAFDPARGLHYFVVDNTDCNHGDFCIPRGRAIWRLTRDGSLTEFAGSADEFGSNDGAGSVARFSTLLGASAIDSQGNLYVADGNRLRKITPDGVVSTVVQQVVPGTPVDNYAPVQALSVDGGGSFYALCSDAVLRKIDRQGQVTELVGAHGQLGYVDGPASIARLQIPSDMAIDPAGNIYLATIAISGSSPPFGSPPPGSVRKVSPDGTVTTIAGQLDKNGIVLGSPGRMYAPSSVLWTSNGLVVGSGWALLKITQ